MMDFIRCETDEGLALVTMARGKANALNTAMVDELLLAVAGATADDTIRGLVLASANPRFFSGGFDVAEVFRYDRETMTDFFGRFVDLYERLLRVPKPVVAAINGHAFAGGAVLAMACDLRLMAEGDYGFALNEINLGIVLPPNVIRAVVAAIGAGPARDVLLNGSTLSPARALEVGLATELATPDAVLARACEHARGLAAKPPAAFGAIKRSILAASGHAAADTDRQALEHFIDHWFSPEAEARKQALIHSLQR